MRTISEVLAANPGSHLSWIEHDKQGAITQGLHIDLDAAILRGETPGEVLRHLIDDFIRDSNGPFSLAFRIEVEYGLP